MRFTEIKNKEKLLFVLEVREYFDALKQQLEESNDAMVGDDILILEQKYDLSYALQVLAKLEKISGYLVKTQLKNAGDLDRFDQFLVVVKTEMPKLSNAFDTIKLEMGNINAINQRHDVFHRRNF